MRKTGIYFGLQVQSEQKLLNQNITTEFRPPTKSDTFRKVDFKISRNQELFFTIDDAGHLTALDAGNSRDVSGVVDSQRTSWNYNRHRQLTHKLAM